MAENKKKGLNVFLPVKETIDPQNKRRCLVLPREEKEKEKKRGSSWEQNLKKRLFGFRMRGSTEEREATPCRIQ